MINRLRHGRIAVLLALATASLPGMALAQREPSREQARNPADWVRQGVIYEIFTRNFSPDGNFNGVTAQLDRLKDLGVTILWLMPIHITGEEKKKGTIGSPYAVRDYYSINPAYGTKQDLQRLVTETHRRGMKIIIDIVANHTSWDSVMMKTPEFYQRDNRGKIRSPHDWTDVAALDYGNAKLRDYMTGMLKYWIREFDLDGFRCDVAGEVPADFWEHARAELEKVKPDIVMLAEASKPDLLVKAFDLDYAWPFHSTLNDILMGNAPASAIQEVIEGERKRFPRGALHMYFSDNHDERRAIARFGESGAMAASALVFLLDGVPLVYNGMEAGDTTESGDPALFERMPIFWPIVKRRPEFPEFYKRMAALRRSHPALQQGELKWLNNSETSRVLTFTRRGESEEILVAINISNRPFSGSVTVESGESFTEITAVTGQVVQKELLPSISLDAWGFRVFRRTPK